MRGISTSPLLMQISLLRNRYQQWKSSSNKLPALGALKQIISVRQRRRQKVEGENKQQFIQHVFYGRTRALSFVKVNGNEMVPNVFVPNPLAYCM